MTRLLGSLRLVVCALILCCEMSVSVEAFFFLTDPPTVWPNGNIPMVLQLGPILATPLKDGSTSFDSVARNALTEWNQHIKTSQFTITTQSSNEHNHGDGITQVFFDSTIYDQSFGDGVLAVTRRLSIGNKRTEGDTIFNLAYQWDSYRGPSLYAPNGDPILDFKRVAQHEFGHTLGLDHPDQHGQNFVALMNHFISDLDHLVDDDVNGAMSLYGGRPLILIEPQSQTVLAGADVTFNVQVRGIPPFNYQWFFNDQPIDGATDSNYSIERVQSSQTGKYSVFVSNSLGSVQSEPATLTIDASTAFGILGAPFAYQIVANNNPNWFSASGLPPGLICDGHTGLIRGVPTRTGTWFAHVKASNPFASVSATISFTIANGAIISANSTLGVIGVPFNFLILADNDPDWFSASGLPPGLICDGRTGLIRGVPTRTGTWSVHVKAENLYGSTSDTITIHIDNGAIFSATSAEGIIGVPFNYQIVSDNNPTWYSASGLPPGLICIGRTGLISGIPTRTGAWSVQVKAENLFGSTSATISITIDGGKIGTGSSPTLGMSRTSDNFVLTWPVTSDGFVLEEIDLQLSSWTNSSAKVVVQGNENVAVIPTTGTMKFFRLRK